ncbi:hypothetical protein DFH27DRAFT_607569 [Peziza echinospora]|nr:hypothetical protein DFH27DRAFT_607569 [Peziza echinospora]
MPKNKRKGKSWRRDAPWTPPPREQGGHMLDRLEASIDQRYRSEQQWGKSSLVWRRSTEAGSSTQSSEWNPSGDRNPTLPGGASVLPSSPASVHTPNTHGTRAEPQTNRDPRHVTRQTNIQPKEAILPCTNSSRDPRMHVDRAKDLEARANEPYAADSSRGPRADRANEPYANSCWDPRTDRANVRYANSSRDPQCGNFNLTMYEVDSAIDLQFSCWRREILRVGLTFLGHRCYDFENKSNISNSTFYKHIASPSTTDDLHNYLQNLQRLQACSPHRAIQPDPGQLAHIQSESPCLTQSALRRLLRPSHQPMVNGEVLPSYLCLGNKQVHELTLQNAKDTVLYYLDAPNRGDRGNIRAEATLGQDLEALLCTLTGVSSLADIHRDGNGRMEFTEWVSRYRAWLHERINRTDKFCKDTDGFVRSMAAKHYNKQRGKSIPEGPSSSTSPTAVSDSAVKRVGYGNSEDDDEMQIISWNYVAKPTAFPLSKNLSAQKSTVAEASTTNKGKGPEKTIEKCTASTTSSPSNTETSTISTQPQATGSDCISEVISQTESLLIEERHAPTAVQTTIRTAESHNDDIQVKTELLEGEHVQFEASSPTPSDTSEYEVSGGRIRRATSELMRLMSEEEVMLHPTASQPVSTFSLPTCTDKDVVEATHDIESVFTTPHSRKADHDEATDDMEPKPTATKLAPVNDYHHKNTYDMAHTSTIGPIRTAPRSWALPFTNAPNYLTNIVPKFTDILSRTYRGLGRQEALPFRNISPEVCRFDEEIREQLRREEREVSEHQKGFDEEIREQLRREEREVIEQKARETPQVGNLVRKEMQCESELREGEAREKKRVKLSEAASCLGDVVMVKEELVKDEHQLDKAPVMGLSSKNSALEAQKVSAFSGTVEDPILLE